MTVESRIFSVASMFPSEGEPIRSVVLETRKTQLSWFGMSIPAGNCSSHSSLAAKTRGLFCREWLVTFQRGNGIVRASGKGDSRVEPGQKVHGARNTGTRPFVLIWSRLWHQPMPVSYWLSDRGNLWSWSNERSGDR